MRLPNHIKAQPTLRGLVPRVNDSDPTPPPHASLYPWDRVTMLNDQTITSVWAVYDADGKRIQAHDRELYLDISGRRANLLAKRLQERSLRRAGSRPDFRLVEEYRRPSRAAVPLLLAFGLLWAGGSIALLLPGLLRNLDEARHLPVPTSYHVFLWAAILGLPAIICALAVAAGRLFIPMARRNVARLTLSQRGIRAELWDTSTVEQPWSDLLFTKHGPSNGCLSFTDGTVLRFLPTARVRTILDAVREELHPAEAAQAERSFRLVAIRIGIYMLAGIIAMGFLAQRLREDSGLPSPGIEEISLFVIGLILIACWCILLLLWSGAFRLPAGWRRMLKRAARATSRRATPRT